MDVQKHIYSEGERHEFGDAFIGSSGRIMIENSWCGKIAKRFGFWHYLHFIEKHIPPGDQGLEFGCGGGNRWLASNYEMTGLEYGMSAVVAAQKVYANSLYGDASDTLFREMSFDFTCSCFVLEHLPPLVAEKTIKEMWRILRPGGKFISLMDLHCDRPFLRKLRERYPAVYRETMIDNPGHLGLVSADQWHEAVIAAGFEIVVWRLQSRFPISDLATYACLASSRSAPLHLRLLGKCASWLASKSPWGFLYLMLLTLLDDVLGWMFPRSWAYRLLFVLQKPQAKSLE